MSLARKQLERKLSPLRSASLDVPRQGWLRALREAMGMTATQLATRMAKVPSRISALEKAEASGNTTLKSLREAAEAMGCTLVYAIVPVRPIDDTLRARATALAEEDLARINHTMRLEDQALERADLEEARDRRIAAYLEGNPHRLWDRP
jgi:predicted DNA-binding mobile mystery protein A